MHRIDGPGATEDNRFIEGSPALGIPPTMVTAAWANAVQEEIIAVIAGAGMALDKEDNGQLRDAIQALMAGHPTYEVGEVYYFRHPTLRPGFAPAQGGLIANAATLYPEAWAYLQTTEGQLLCTTEVAWQAMTTATWATLADGTHVGWNGIGGAPYYVQDLVAGTLRVPDLRGMYVEGAGFDALGVGGVHGDGMRRITGSLVLRGPTSNAATGVFYSAQNPQTAIAQTTGSNAYNAYFDSERVAPIANQTQPRAWGALACVYLGRPAS